MIGMGHMYITERELKVRWLLVTTTMPSLASFDVVVHRPDSTPLGNVGGVYLESYSALATSASYTISYTFTPDVPGVWSVKLSIGSSDTYRVLKKVNLTIHDSDKDIFQQVTLSVLPEAPEPLPINVSLSDSIDFSSELANDNTLDFIAVFASTTPYPYIPDRDVIVFDAEISGTNTLTTIIINKNTDDGILFSSEVAGTNTLTQVVVNKNTGRDELLFGAEIAGVNTLRAVVINTTVDADTIAFSSEVAGVNTLIRVVLEDDTGSDTLVFDSSIDTSSVNTLTTI